MAYNTKNLKKFTREECSRNGKKGAMVAQENRKRRASLKEALSTLLSIDVKKADVKRELTRLGIEKDYQTNEVAIALAMIKNAVEGDVKSAQFVRDTIGEKPGEKIEATVSNDTTVVVLPDNNRDGD